MEIINDYTMPSNNRELRLSCCVDDEQKIIPCQVITGNYDHAHTVDVVL